MWRRLRSRLVTAGLVLVVVLAWLYLAPTQIGGSDAYVTTSGISMEPRFHSGDLAVVRPVDRYRVGDVVAYHSTLLRVVVLHRIVAVHGNRYVFKGDNNNFLDPVQPTRAELLGKLWLHVSGGGVALRWLHTPVDAALLSAVAVALMLVGANQSRRRRNRRRKGSTVNGPPMTPNRPHVGLPVSTTALLAGSGAAAAAFLAIALVAFTRPTARPARVPLPYSQQVSFAYHGNAPAGPVYPTGSVSTGDPIFLQLVHRLNFTIGYRLKTLAPHLLSGTERVLLRINGSTGWNRTVPLAPATHFKGDDVTAHVALDLPSLLSLVNQVQLQTGGSGDAGYSFVLLPQVHVHGRLSGQPLNATFAPALSLQLNSLQLQPASSGSGPSAGSGNLNPTQPGNVSVPTTASNDLKVFGQHIPVRDLRWTSVAGLLLSGICALLALLLKRAEPFEESARIKAQYGHLIVPVVLDQNDLGWPAIDVASIKALVRLAESGQRLILHRPDPGGDTFLVNDEGTVYRYQVQPSNVVWGEWRPTAPRPVAAAAAESAKPDEMSAGSSIA